MSLQFCAAILAVRPRWSCVFRSAPARSSLERTNRRVTKNNFCGFVGHFVEQITKTRSKRLLCNALFLDDAEMSPYNAGMKTFTTTIISLLAISTFGLTAARADQPHMRQALQNLRAALAQLQAAVPDKAGWRDRAIQSTRTAITQTQNGMAAAR